ncbi:MAG: hypothetical protein JWN63_2258, partial [Candidatus Acidoferrum typicum]|nr:hypothetical protein [Candidatus Acidoferrum typicum]
MKMPFLWTKLTAWDSFFLHSKNSHSDRKAKRLSGIVGIYHRNGAPIEQALLR